MFCDHNGDFYFKVALHLHSTVSDGRLSPDEIVSLYRRGGFDAIAITDHWKFQGERNFDDFLVLSGCEYNVGGRRKAMHLVGLGMKSEPKLDRDASKQEIIDAIHSASGIAVLAHPAWSLNSLEEAKALQGIDATEIYNSVSECGESLRAYSDHFVDLCARNNLHFGILATDDAHYYGGIDDQKGWVMVRAKSLSSDSILKAIRERDFYATQGPHLSVQKRGDKIVIDTSPCCIIAVLSDAAHIKGHTVRGENLTHFEYPIHEEDGWIRVEARDGDGKRAWSNIIAL